MISAVGSLIFTALLVSAAAPNPVSVSPSSGPTTGATAITITGTLFQNGCTGTLDGIAIPITFVSSTSLTSTTPADTLGAKTLVIRNPDGKSTSLASAFTYAAATPTVVSVSPNLADTAGGGQLITITGTNFTGATGVMIGGSAATSITVVNATTITCFPPAHTSGVNQSILVTTPSGTNTANTLFEFWTPAQITGVDVYLDAAKGQAISASNTWTDQSSHAVVFTQATTINKPVAFTNVWGNMPSLRFNGSRWVKAPAIRAMATGYSVFWGAQTSVVFGAPGGVDAPGTVTGQFGGTNWGGVGYDQGSGGGSSPGGGLYSRVYNAAGSIAPVATATASGSGFNDGVARMLGWTSDTTPVRKAYRGSVSQTVVGGSPAGGYDTVDTAWDTVGAGSAGGDGFNGDLAWVVWVVGVISVGDLAKLATWSLQRWGF